MAGVRRGNSEGSINHRKRDNLWEVRITVDGRRKSYYLKTYDEAIRKLTELRYQRDHGAPVLKDERLTLERFLVGWLDRMIIKIKPSTHKRYTELLRLHVIPKLGKVALAKLTAEQVEELYGKCIAKGLSSTTVRQLRAVLHHALNDALRKSLVVRNVVDQTDPPRIVRHDIRVLTADEAQQLLDVARNHRLEALFVLALTTGMRQGEMLGTKWDCVDLQRGALQVRKTLRRGKNGLELGEPKTPQSRRLLMLPPMTVEALRAHKERQEEERTFAGDDWKESGLVFTTMTGEPVSGVRVLRNDFYPLLQEAGLPRVRFHDLRHTAASLLLARGMHPKIVSTLLGHSGIHITMDIYSHTTSGMVADATAALQSMLTNR